MNESFSHKVNANGKLIPFRLEFRLAVGADEGGVHQKKISNDENKRNGNSDNVPRNLRGGGDKIHPAGAEKYRRADA